MKQVITGRTATVALGTVYGSLMGNQAVNANEFGTQAVIPTSGTLSNFRVHLATAPGGTTGRTIAVIINGTPVLSVTITGTNKDAVDTNSVAVSPGDRVGIRYTVSSGSPGTSDATFACTFEGDIAGESILLGNTNYSGLSLVSAVYCSVANALNPTATEGDCRQIIPTPGTLKKLYWSCGDPGDAPDGFRATLRKNGVSQALTSDIVADNTTGNDTTHSFTVAAGDNVTMMFEPISTPTNATAAIWGMVFVADTDGESLILGGTTDALSNSATEYNVVAGQGMVWGATENYTLLNACTLKKFYVELSASPRGNNDNDSYTFTIRIDAGNTTITTLIKDGGTGNKVGNDTTHTYNAADTASLKLQCVPSSSPAVVDAYWGLVCFIQPVYTYNESVTFALSAGLTRTGLMILVEAAVFALSAAQDPLAGMSFDEAVTLAVQAAKARSAVLSAGESVILAMNASEIESAVAELNDNISLGISADVLRSHVLSAVEACAFGISADISRSHVLSMAEMCAFGIVVAKALSTGMDFTEAVTLAVQAAKDRSASVTAEESATLDVRASEARSSSLEAVEGVSLGISADAISTAFLSMIEACAFGIAVSKALAAGSNFTEAVVLAVNAIEGQSASLEMNAGLSLGIAADQGTGNALSLDAVIALSLAMAMLQTGNVDVGPQTYDEAATLAAAAGMSQSAVGSLQEAVTLAAAVGQGQAGQSILINALVLQATASMIQNSVGSFSASLNMDISADAAFGTALILQAAALLGVSASLSESGGMSFEDAAALGIRSDMAQVVGALLSAAVSINAQVSQVATTTLTAEAQIALSIACEQIDSYVGNAVYDVSAALSIVAGMAQWGIAPRIAAAKHLLDAMARKREYDAEARKREYDATARKREHDDE
jgi:hypothetical protein